jgi:hypothetical protein
MRYNPNDVNSWGGFSPLIIAHDVGRSRDRSTAVVGGNSPMGQRLLGVAAAEELPQGLFGSARAAALAAVDARYGHNGLIVVDVSFDPTYGEILVQNFGRRVIGLQIVSHGDGTKFETRTTKFGALLVYSVGRSFLIELLHSEFQSDQLRLSNDRGVRHAFDQLARLEVEYKQGGVVYSCASGQHDDLGISLAMLAFAAKHPHLEYWARNIPSARRRRPRSTNNNGWAAHT